MSGHRYTKEEKNFIKKNAKKLSAQQVADELGRDVQSIRVYASKHDICFKGVKKKDLTYVINYKSNNTVKNIEIPAKNKNIAIQRVEKGVIDLGHRFTLLNVHAKGVQYEI